PAGIFDLASLSFQVPRLASAARETATPRRNTARDAKIVLAFILPTLLSFSDPCWWADPILDPWSRSNCNPAIADTYERESRDLPRRQGGLRCAAPCSSRSSWRSPPFRRRRIRRRSSVSGRGHLSASTSRRRRAAPTKT